MNLLKKRIRAFSIKNLPGLGCVGAISFLKLLPVNVTFSFLSIFLPLYPLFRREHIKKINRLFNISPYDDILSISNYYRSRLILFLDTIKLHGSCICPENLEILGEEHYTSALESGSPVILLGLHMGLFELLHKIPFKKAAEYRKSFHVITAETFSPVLTRYINKGRWEPEKTITSNSSLLSAVKTALKSRGVLAVMADQSPERDKGQLALWETILIPFNPRLIKSMLNQGGTVIPISTRRKSSGNSILEYYPPLLSKADASPQEINSFVKSFLEKAIGSAPEQWNWSYPGVKKKFESVKKFESSGVRKFVS